MDTCIKKIEELEKKITEKDQIITSCQNQINNLIGECMKKQTVKISHKREGLKKRKKSIESQVGSTKVSVRGFTQPLLGKETNYF